MENYLGGHGLTVFDSVPGTSFKDVLAAIHATPSLTAGQSFRDCTDPPFEALLHQDGLGVVPDIQALLETGTIRILFYNGIHDLICNHVGNEEAVENIEWTHQVEYQRSQRYGWRSSLTGEIGGYMKEFNNLMYLKVLNAGHMVPMDVPDVSLDMLRTFVFNQSFQTYPQFIYDLAKVDAKGDQACDPPSSLSSSSTSMLSAGGTISIKSEGVVWVIVAFFGLSFVSLLL
jgi:hypothetical protein